MISKLFLVFVIQVFVCLFQFGDCQAHFTIVVPKKIRTCGNVLATVYDLTKDVFVNVSLYNSKNFQSWHNSEKFSPNSPSKLIPIPISGNDHDNFTLKVSSTELNYENSFPVQYVPKEAIIMIQTDKGIYKPGQEVNFRVLMLDHSLRPIDYKEIKHLKINVVNPQNIILFQYTIASPDTNTEQFDEVMFSRGVTGDKKITLHDEAVLGTWKIQVIGQNINDILSEQKFKVDEYKLPMANLTLRLPKFIKNVDQNTILRTNIDFYYTFGKPVIGSYNLSIEDISTCKISDSPNFHQFETKQINGSINFEANLNDLNLVNHKCNEMNFEVKVSAIDSVNNDIYKSIETFSVVKNDILAVIQDKATLFRPGKIVSKKVKITNLMGEKVKEENLRSLSCHVISKEDQYDRRAFNKWTKDGLIICDFYTQNWQNSLNFKIKTPDNKILVSQDLTVTPGCKKDYIQITLQQTSKVPKLDEEIQLTVTSSSTLIFATFYVISRGSIIYHDHILFGTGRRVAFKTLKITKEMLPYSSLFVHAKLNNSNQFVSDSLTLMSDVLYANHMSITLNKTSYNPGEKAKIQIKTKKDSQIFILGVDEAVLLLKKSNDITTTRILENIVKKSDQDDPSGSFNDEMILDTDLEKECPSARLFSELTEPDDDDDNEIQTESIRKDFRETWIWESFQTIDETSKRSIKVPDSITTFQLTGFSIHNDYGLGIAEIPAKVTVIKNFFVKLNFPYSIKRNEKTQVHVMAFNYQTKLIRASLKLSVKDEKDENKIEFSDCDHSLDFDLNPEQTKYLSCHIMANEVGKFDIVAKIDGIYTEEDHNVQGDGEMRTLLVKYEGITETQSQTLFLDLTEDNENKLINYTFNVEKPENIIPGSERMFLSASSELITERWNKEVEKLIDINKGLNLDFEMPQGCCQQAAQHQYKKLFWLDYVNHTKSANLSEYEKALNGASEILQLSTQCLNQEDSEELWAFSNFGEVLGRSSTWMTILFLKMFKLAQTYVKVDPNLIMKAENWLKNSSQCIGCKRPHPMQVTGEFVENDQERSIYTTGTNVYITAFALLALNEPNQKSLDWLSRKFDNLNNNLDIVSSCYALNYFNHASNNSCYSKVMSMANQTYDEIYWKNENDKTDYHVTAYGLMLLTQRKDYKNALKVFRFLSKTQTLDGRQTDPGIGSFQHSYNTMICTEALTKFVVTLPYYEPDNLKVDIKFQSGNLFQEDLKLRTKKQAVQVVQVDPQAKIINVSAQGYGRVNINLFMQYNTNKQLKGDFNLVIKHETIGHKSYLTICTSLENQNRANNVIVDFDLPSGFRFDGHFEKGDTNIDRIEGTNEGTHVNVYITKVESKQICFKIHVIESHSVEQRHSTPLKVYQYYNRTSMTIDYLNFN